MKLPLFLSGQLAEDGRVGRVQLLKPFRRLRIALMQIRMMPLGELPVRGLDRRLIGAPRDAQNFVGVPHDRLT